MLYIIYYMIDHVIYITYKELYGKSIQSKDNKDQGQKDWAVAGSLPQKAGEYN